MRARFLIICCLLSTFLSLASEWQWSVPIEGFVSNETNEHPRAFLWIPSNCKQVRGIVVGQHNMSEEGIMEHPAFRKGMSELGFATIWITPGISQEWNTPENVQTIFDNMLESLADVSGYSELKYAPIVPIGHSAMATFPWNFGAWNPERTLAILSVHGDSPRTHLTGYGRKNPDWGGRTVEGIPGLIVMGEYEWWEDRLFTAFDYRRDYPEAPLSLLADAGRGHFDHSDGLVDYLVLFLKKAAKYRLPKRMPLDAPAKLIKVNATDGWLADRWHKDALPRAKSAPYSEYRGEKNEAFWYFDKEMAQATERYYTRVRGKRDQYIGFTQNGTLLNFKPESHSRIDAKFQPEADGITFHLGAIYTDTLRRFPSHEHGKTAIKLSRICGPVTQLGDTTFTVSFYRMGMHNPRRTPAIWLLATSEGDDEYKSAVQQFTMNIPYRIEEGREQRISFPALNNVNRKTKRISLSATADSGLPVHYYIKEGAAEIVGNEVVFTRIPPRANYPLKVTVVAWQYGIIGKWKTAEPVEQSFYICL